jgi:glucose-1-phosphate thymidylyltransferase
MKGIIYAGGSGTRLHPLTLAMSKQMMPVYDKPMIYYPLMMAGIHEILIISTHLICLISKNCWVTASIGCEFSYAEQAIPNGLAQALGKILLAMIVLHYGLGDNIFFEF